jgi:ankyrin repeat protein
MNVLRSIVNVLIVLGLIWLGGMWLKQDRLNNPRDARDLAETIADGRIAIAIAAVRAGVDLKGVHGKRGTPLHAATYAGYRDGAEELTGLLLAKGLDPNAKSPDGYTPLKIAMSSASTGVVKSLVAAGANAREPGLLHRAAERTDDAVAVLLAAGASPHETDTWGATPLHRAAYKRMTPAKTLLEAGAAIDARDQAGQTPLHLAASGHGNAEMVRFLVERGADVDARDKAGLRPLDHAERLGHRDNAAFVSVGYSKGIQGAASGKK